MARTARRYPRGADLTVVTQAPARLDKYTAAPALSLDPPERGARGDRVARFLDDRGHHLRREQPERDRVDGEPAHQLDLALGDELVDQPVDGPADLGAF